MNATQFENVKSVLVVLSSKAMSYDMPALRSLITHSYPGAAVFFISTSGDAMGAKAPEKIDLVIDFTQPGARQAWGFARKMKSRSRFTVGRKAGLFFRKSSYTRILDEAKEKNAGKLPQDYLESEAWAQKKVLELAGVPVVKQGGVGQDRGKDIAFEKTR